MQRAIESHSHCQGERSNRYDWQPYWERGSGNGSKQRNRTGDRVGLSRQGVELCLVGRNPFTVAETVTAAKQFSKVASFQIDLTDQDNLLPLLRHLKEVGTLNILIPFAGVIHPDLMEHACIEDLDLQ